MYVRIRKVKKNELVPGDENIMVATTKQGSIIEVGPGVMEWWDGLEWKKIPVVEENDMVDPV
jgi:hypothetical protein